MPNSSASTYTTKMKLTDEGRLFSKDMFDLLAALIIQMQLSDHRTFFKSYPSTFTTDEAIQCLKALKFTHVVKTLDNNTNTNTNTTTNNNTTTTSNNNNDNNTTNTNNNMVGYQYTRTTTTFSMSKEMVKPLLQQFIYSRLIINATEPTNKIVKDKGIYSITPKGKYMIQDFSERAHVSIQHMDQHLSTISNTSVVPLERLIETDHLTFDRNNITACFKIMMSKIPLERILADDVGGLKYHNLPDEYSHTFYGYQCFEWISQYTTVVTKEEAEMVCGELVLYGWIAHIIDKSDLSSNYYDDAVLFRTTKNALYHITERGRIILGWVELGTNKSISSTGSGNHESSSSNNRNKNNPYGLSTPIDYYNRPSSISNSETDVLTTTDDAAQLVRLKHILEIPLLRMYFRIYLKENFCDENINFWLAYFSMRKKKKTQHTKNGLKDMLTDGYAIYDTFIKYNASQEVNIDHTLKQQIEKLIQSTFSVVSSNPKNASTPFSSPAMPTNSNSLLSTTTISVNAPLAQCLTELMGLYDKVNDHLCRMMAQDSVPRYLKVEKYQPFFKSHLPPIQPQNGPTPPSSTSSSSTPELTMKGNELGNTNGLGEKNSTLLNSVNTTSSVTQLSVGINNLTCSD